MAAALVLALAIVVGAQAQASGSLSQAAPTGCISEDGSGGTCTDGKALQSANSTAVSPDGNSVYVTFVESEFEGGVAVFRRNTTTGQLTQLADAGGCVSETGSNGACTDGRTLIVPSAVTVSPDNTSVYVASAAGVAVFRRNTTNGRLTQLAGTAGCVSGSGSGGSCTAARGVGSPSSVTVSPDNTSVYVTSGIPTNAVAVFQRNVTNGALTQPAGNAGCVSETGAGPCADGKALQGASSVAVSPGGGASVYVTSADPGNAVAAFQRNTTNGTLTQLAGNAGCVSETGAGPCADGKALAGAVSVAVSPDGENVYVASISPSSAVAVFRRNTTGGALTQLANNAGCVSQTGAGPCADGKALNAASSVAVSADGKNVYVASRGSSAVAIFKRNATNGGLTQLANNAGCVSLGGAGPCTAGSGLQGASSVAVSADGKNAYVASRDNGEVAILRRNATTGTLIQLATGCVSETGTVGSCIDGKALDDPSAVAVSPDGSHVYVASQLSDAVAIFKRNTTTGQLTQLAGTTGCVSETGAGPCADGRGLNGARSVTVSADGESVYVASDLSDAVAAFDRNTGTGALTQLAGTAGCTSETGSGGDCVDGNGLDGAQSVAVSADGTSVYAAAPTDSAVAVFSRDTTTGELTQPAGTGGCVSEIGFGGCVSGKALIGAISVSVSPDDEHVYVASLGSDAVAAFDRNTGTGALTQLSGMAGCISETGTSGDCVDGRGLDGATAVDTVTASGNSGVYVASRTADALAGFSRNTTTGQLTQFGGALGCISETGTTGTCGDGRALNGATSVTVDAGGSRIYVASEFSDAVAVFARSITGQFSQLAGSDGCINESGTVGCVDGRELDGARSVALSADGKNLYAASLHSDAVAVLAVAP